jgi:RecA/RadA recombinase
MSFFKSIVKELGNEFASLVDDGISAGDCETYVDTGSYILNALISGSIFGGLPSNKITALAGDSGTGKTFFALSIVKHFLDSQKNGEVIYFETESAISKKMLASRDIDVKRVGMVPVSTVQEFRTQSIKIIDEYVKLKKNNRPPLLFVLDSLGMLSTTKEVQDATEGKETRDMTRAQVIKSIFRILSLKLGQAGIPLIVTNHTYDSINSIYPTKEMGGGTGLKYSASSILFLSKKKEKDGTEVVGNIIKVKAQKSRFTKENSEIETRLYFDSRGLDKYYGLLELGEKYKVFEKIGNRVKMGESNVYPSAIYKNPEKYFTPEVLKVLDEYAKKEFLYGVTDAGKNGTDDSEESSL